MNFQEYQALSQRTANREIPPIPPERLALLNASMGLAGECGEFVDLMKKVIFHGHVLDRDKAVSELGDVLWYVQWAAREVGASLAEVADYNVDKLAKRYPSGFSEQASRERIA